MKSLTILYADDDDDDVYLFYDVINEIPKVTCITAENGLKALEVLKTKKIDLVLLDLNMPRMNGFECLNLIREDHQLKTIPVIMYSTSDHEKQKCLDAGATDFILKAKSFFEMKQSIISIVAKYRARL